MLVFDMDISFSAYRTTTTAIHWRNDEMQREVNEKKKTGPALAERGPAFIRKRSEKFCLGENGQGDGNRSLTPEV